MQELGMIPKTQRGTLPPQRVLLTIKELYAPFDGIFRPTYPEREVHVGEKLGTVHTYDGKTKDLLAPVSGLMVWRKETMAMCKGEVLCAIAY
jgi:predicted deacylase